MVKVKPKPFFKWMVLGLVLTTFALTLAQSRTIERMERELEIAQEHIWTLYQEQADIREILEGLREQQQTESQERVDKLLEYFGVGAYGEYEFTAYTAACGNGDGVTSIGAVPTVGRTIAVDPKVIPYGSLVFVDGYGWRVAEDTGGAIKGNKLNLLVDSKTEAFQVGRRKVLALVIIR